MALTAGDLLPMVKKLAASYLEEIGDDDGQQNYYIFQYLTHSLRKLADIAYQQRESNPLYISSDGDAVFMRGSSDITNMYAPLRILDPDGRELTKRTSFADSKGWWRESSNTQINIKGYGLATQPLKPGNHILQYIAYPDPIVSTTSPVQFPDAGTLGLCYYCAGLILESRPTAKDLVLHYMNIARGHLKITVQANIAARGASSGGYVPSLATVDTAFGGA